MTTGAESDLEQVTMIARQMVGRWGMSKEVGLVSVVPSAAEDYALPTSDPISEHTRRLVDAEVRRIIDEGYISALELLRNNRDRLDSLAEKLLEHESLDEADAYRAAGFIEDLSSNGHLSDAAELN